LSSVLASASRPAPPAVAAPALLPEAAPHRQSRLIGGIARLLLEKRSLPVQLAVGLAAVAAATGLRMAVDGSLPPGFPFLTFFPAVLIAAVFGSLRIGIATAILSGLIAWIWFIPPKGALSTDPQALVAMAFYVLVTATELFFIAMTAHALRQMRKALARADDLALSRDLMFAELQHRVSNNLSTVGALLRMQSGKVGSAEAKQALLEATQRLNTVARIQRSLYSPDLQEVQVRPFLTQLAQDTLTSFGEDKAVDLTVTAQDFRLSQDRAIPFGLVASEMMMNALEHGQPATGRGALIVTFDLADDLETAGASAVLTVTDNGPGLPDGVTVDTATGLGIGIARQFARQLDGTLTMTPRPGTPGAIARLVFPLRPVAA
jgi:two-component sensor histidine kinase